jgi:excisionase family DNA binding protein
MSMPDFLTVSEAAQILRIGRTAAYALAARFEQTGGAQGLPVIRIGKQLRVPRARLEQLAGGALLATPCQDAIEEALST